MPGSRHIACTVEMAEVRAKVERSPGTFSSSHSATSSSPHASSPHDPPPIFFDVAVLDEIQLIGDPSRGWAWTRALHGTPAKEIHVCGDGSAAALVEALCERSGDHFELERHSRFRPLRVDEEGLPRGLADVQSGDCVVAFSRAVRRFLSSFFHFSRVGFFFFRRREKVQEKKRLTFFFFPSLSLQNFPFPGRPRRPRRRRVRHGPPRRLCLRCLATGDPPVAGARVQRCGFGRRRAGGFGRCGHGFKLEHPASGVHDAREARGEGGGRRRGRREAAAGGKEGFGS